MAITTTGTLKVTGKTTVGSTLTASQGTFNDSLGVNNITYIWDRNFIDSNGDLQYTQIGVGSTYKLTALDIGKNVTVRAEYTTIPTGLDTVALLKASDELSVLNRVHTGGVSIKGTSTVGSVLSAVSTLKDKDGLGTLSYEWTATDADGTRILDSDTSTYKLTEMDDGAKISVKVSYLDKASHYETATSKATSVVTYSTKTSVADDKLTATVDVDKLTGGLGADQFIFNAINMSGTTVASRDVIIDFNHSQGDLIDLSKIDAIPSNPVTANGVTTNVNDVFHWLDVAPTMHSGDPVGAVWFDSKTSTLYASNDTDIDPEFSIQLTGVTVLEEIDVIL